MDIHYVHVYVHVSFVFLFVLLYHFHLYEHCKESMNNVIYNGFFNI